MEAATGRAPDPAQIEGTTRRKLRAAGHEVVEFGDCRLSPDDDYPDFIVPLAGAVASGVVERGVAICGSVAVSVLIFDANLPPEVCPMLTTTASWVCSPTRKAA